MQQGLLRPWRPCTCNTSPSPYLLPFITVAIPKPKFSTIISATLESAAGEQLTARERRRLRNEKRQSKAAADGNWREEVELKLLKKAKPRYTSWKEELNLDTLARLGPQWWIVRVSRVSSQDIPERLARSLALKFPGLEFKIYPAAVQVKKKLKNGSLSVKPKPLFPGCVFLRCVLNKEIHDFIREYDGVGGFAGARVGNMIRQINKPRPVSVEDMEAILRKVKEEQEKCDQAFEKEQSGEGSQLDPNRDTESTADLKQKRLSTEASKGLVLGSSVLVVSGTFADFVGKVQKLNRKKGKVTVQYRLLGRETLVELDINEVVPETTNLES